MSMSRGTMDQVYLGMRLALSRTVAGGRRLPLFLDDPLVNFDPNRRGAALAALLEMAKTHQIILLANDPSYLDMLPSCLSVIRMDSSEKASKDV